MTEESRADPPRYVRPVPAPFKGSPPSYKPKPSHLGSGTAHRSSTYNTNSDPTQTRNSLFEARVALPTSSPPPQIVGPPLPPGPLTGSKRVVLAIDYGTTYTGLAVALTEDHHAKLEDIEVLQNWGDGVDNTHKVRTMISYVASSTGQAQWGSNVSDQVSAMVNTKLELEPQPTRYDELELTWYQLKGVGNLGFDHLKSLGPNPAYPGVPPERIVQDYLRHIYASACRTRVFNNVELSRLDDLKIPLDIVVTVPAKWSSEATDATFKAVRGAGFNKKNFPTLGDMILVTEPEAAFFFAIRNYQKIHKDRATSEAELLEDNDTFILADAGGGTVDVVSYQVKKTKPNLEIEKVTEADSSKCGSVFIDTAFKTWLRDEVLGPECYGQLDPLNTHGRITAHSLEQGSLRTLIKDFIVRKEEFRTGSPDINLDLPRELAGLEVEGRLREGELTIYQDEMEDLFEHCVDGVITLLRSQTEKLKKATNRRPRAVFLVGGFGASPYLQERLDRSLNLTRDSILQRPDPDKSLTAVVQGAVIYGVEKSHHSNVKYMSAVEENYGFCVHGRFHWLIKRGDLLLSNQARTVMSSSFTLRSKACPGGRFVLPVYKFKKRHPEDDDRPEDYEDGQHEVKEMFQVTCDISALVDRSSRAPTHQEAGSATVVGPFKCHFQLSQKALRVDVMHKRVVIAKGEVSLMATVPETQRSANGNGRAW